MTTFFIKGGADLTPYYLFDEDITSFHEKMKSLCDSHSNSVHDNNDGDHDDDHDSELINYQKMKKSCDDYFYLPARSEHRGVGGIFFDDLPASQRTLAFVKDVCSSWMPSWFPIIEKRQPLDYTEQQRNWQLLRRGRYLEFNLLYDRGVKFGLANANPRVEGVMVSAPPLIAWEYNHVIEDGSEEDRLMKILKTPIDWVSSK
jgi:coproporphyrinogen III oxidase